MLGGNEADRANEMGQRSASDGERGDCGEFLTCSLWPYKPAVLEIRLTDSDGVLVPLWQACKWEHYL